MKVPGQTLEEQKKWASEEDEEEEDLVDDALESLQAQLDDLNKDYVTKKLGTRKKTRAFISVKGLDGIEIYGNSVAWGTEWYKDWVWKGEMKKFKGE